MDLVLLKPILLDDNYCTFIRLLSKSKWEQKNNVYEHNDWLAISDKFVELVTLIKLPTYKYKLGT